MNWQELALKLTDIFVKWGPTFIFVLLVLFGVLIGFARGYNKSKRLLKTALILFTINLALYLVICFVPAVDQSLLLVTNTILGGDGALQNILGVSTKCETFKEIIAEFLILKVKTQDLIYAILTNNVDYVHLVINLAYHIVFAILFVTLYLIEDFICYLVYAISRKNKKKSAAQLDKFIRGEVEDSSSKRRLAGATIGLGRGLVSGFIAVSILGGVLFVAVGKGNNKSDDYTFKDDTINFSYKIYQSFSEYGNYGIYKILNQFTNQDDVPYYLFALDIMLQGQYENTSEGYSYTVHFLDEIGSISYFSHDIANLMLKYGRDSIIPILVGEKSTDELYTELMNLMKDVEFQSELSSAIRKIQSADFTKKLAISLAYNVAGNIEQINSSLDENIVELCHVLFKQNYLSPKINLEAALIAKGADATKLDIPVITSDFIISENDVNTLLEMVYKVCSYDLQNLDIKEVVKAVLPLLKNLSYFSSTGRSDLNPIFSRLYAFAEENYMTKLIPTTTSEEELAKKYKNIDVNDYKKSALKDDIISLGYTEDTLNWTKEFSRLLDCAEDALVLYEKSGVTSISDPLEFMSTLFSSDNKYSKIIDLKFEDILENIEESQLLNRVLGSQVINEYLIKQMESAISGITLPDNIKYTNTYNEEGELVSYGETHYLFRLLRFFYSDKLKDLRTSLFDTSVSKDFAFVKEHLATALALPDSKTKQTLADYISNSDILSSFISQTLVSASTQNDKTLIYIPESIKHVNSNGKTIDVIDKEHIKPLLDGEILTALLDAIEPLMSGETTDIVNFITSDSVEKITSLELIQATFGNVFIYYMQDNASIVIPDGLDVPSNWVGDEGEARSLIYALRENKDILNGLLGEGADFSNVFNAIINISDENLEKLCASQVMHYSLSKVLSNSEQTSFTISIPDSVVEYNIKNSKQTKIKLDELKGLLSVLKEIGLDSYDNFKEDTFKKIKVDTISSAINKSDIFYATVSDYISKNTTIIIPRDILENGYIKKEQITNLFDSFKVLLGNDISIGSINAENVDYSKLKDDKDARDKFSQSDIINATIVDKIKSNNINYKLYVDSSKMRTSKSVSGGNTCIVLDSTELSNLIYGFTYLGGDTTISLDVQGILKMYTNDKTNFMKIFDSSTITYFVSDFIYDYVKDYEVYFKAKGVDISFDVSPVDTISLSDHKQTTKGYYSTDRLEKILDALSQIPSEK